MILMFNLPVNINIIPINTTRLKKKNCYVFTFIIINITIMNNNSNK